MGFICAVTDRSGNHAEVVGNKKSFNTDSAPFDKASRLNCQLKFFGFKPKRFISSYAKKPRIICKVKANRKPIKTRLCDDIGRQIAALYQGQMNRGMQNTFTGYSQIAAAQNAAQQQMTGAQAALSQQSGLVTGIGLGFLQGVN